MLMRQIGSATQTWANPSGSSRMKVIAAVPARERRAGTAWRRWNAARSAMREAAASGRFEACALGPLWRTSFGLSWHRSPKRSWIAQCAAKSRVRRVEVVVAVDAAGAPVDGLELVARAPSG